MTGGAMQDLTFYKGKKVFVTGHTGFKGSWLCVLLLKAGAYVTGYSLEPPTTPSLFKQAGLCDKINHVIGDVRDLDHLVRTMKETSPEIVLHLAAQPIVLESYKDPVTTYSTNVMGTVNILEGVRQTPSVRSFLNVTTDKVYRNNEWCWGYRENDPLDGFEPYSNSKSCSELVTHSYARSLLSDGRVMISTARAGNVIGGGDYAADRIIPDCVRDVRAGKKIFVRNPYSTRPYQHVLEPLYAYLMIAKGQYEDPKLAGSYNVGPEDSDCVTTGHLVDMFCEAYGPSASWESGAVTGPHEANFLKLDCSLLRSVYGWRNVWNVRKAIEKTVEWTKRTDAGQSAMDVCSEEIDEFFADLRTL